MKKRFIVLLLLLALIAAGAGAFQMYRNSHVFYAGKAYPADLTELDLRNEAVLKEDVDALQALLPDCRILWSVPMQGQRISSDTTEVTLTGSPEPEALALLEKLQTVDANACTPDEVRLLLARFPQLDIRYHVTVDGTDYPKDADSITAAHLTDEDLAVLDLLPDLKAVDAAACRDYPQLKALKAARPELSMDYFVELGGETLPWDTKTLAYGSQIPGDLAEKLEWLPAVERVEMEEPECDPALLRELVERCPNTTFYWSKTVLGQTHTTEETEFDFSQMELTTDQVEAAMAWFPGAEIVDLSFCGLDSPTLGEFREKMRSEYKVVWTVKITGILVRTDETVFHSSAHHMSLQDGLSDDLYYCEDMIVVDVGHGRLRDISWVEGMPNLKYLIIADNWITDITPISTCKNLIYLELLKNDSLRDISPVVGCTALEDVSVSNCFVVDVTPFAQMPWLKNIWANNCNLKPEQAAWLQEQLPDTHIQWDDGYYSGGGWRELQNYHDMRDIMGMPHNNW